MSRTILYIILVFIGAALIVLSGYLAGKSIFN